MKLSRRSVSLAVGVLTLLAIFAWQYRNAVIAGKVLDDATYFITECIDKKSNCGFAGSAYTDLEKRLASIFPPIARLTVDHDKYLYLKNKLMPEAAPDIEADRLELEQFNKKAQDVFKSVDDLIAKSDDARQKALVAYKAEYKELAAPKLLYSCNGMISLLASKGIENYNALYDEARQGCAEDIEIILSAK